MVAYVRLFCFNLVDNHASVSDASSFSVVDLFTTSTSCDFGLFPYYLLLVAIFDALAMHLICLWF